MAVFIRPVPGTHPSGARQNRALVKNRSRRFFRRQSLALRVTVANSKSNQKCRAPLIQPFGSLRAIVYENKEELLPPGAALMHIPVQKRSSRHPWRSRPLVPAILKTDSRLEGQNLKPKT